MAKRLRSDVDHESTEEPIISPQKPDPGYTSHSSNNLQPTGSAQDADGQYTLTDDEAMIYDRQLRIWGVEAQQKMRQANVLVIGKIGGLSAEICKNIALSGIGSITMCDSTPLSSAGSLGSNFLVYGTPEISQHALEGSEELLATYTQASASVQGLQELNPNVKVSAIEYPTNISDIDFSPYTMVICVNIDFNTAVSINTICRSTPSSCRFYYCYLTMHFGLFFIDYAGSLSTTHVPLAESLSLAGISCTNHPIAPVPPFPTEQDIASYFRQHRSLSRQQVRYTVSSIHYIRHLASVFPSDSTTVHPVLQSTGPTPSNFKPPALPPAGCTNLEFTPICAIFGGIICQEVLRSFSQDHKPLGGDNWVIFDSNTCFSSHLLPFNQ